MTMSYMIMSTPPSSPSVTVPRVFKLEQRASEERVNDFRNLTIYVPRVLCASLYGLRGVHRATRKGGVEKRGAANPPLLYTGAYPFISYLDHLAMYHVSLSRRSTVTILSKGGWASLEDETIPRHFHLDVACTEYPIRGTVRDDRRQNFQVISSIAHLALLKNRLTWQRLLVFFSC